MSVKSRILQFQQNTSTPSTNGNGGGIIANKISLINVNNHSHNSNIHNNNVVVSNTGFTKSNNNTTTISVNNNSINNCNTNKNNNLSSQQFTLPVPIPPILIRQSVVSSNTNNRYNNHIVSPPSNTNNPTTYGGNIKPHHHHQQVHDNHNNNQPHKHNHSQINRPTSINISTGTSSTSTNIAGVLRKVETTTELKNPNSNKPHIVNGNSKTTGSILVASPSKTDQLRNFNSFNNNNCNNNNSVNMSNGNPPVNRATKPTLMNKKASMTINLTSGSNNATTTNGNGQETLCSQQRPKFARSPSNCSTPARTLSSSSSSSPSSAIPKPFGGSNGALHNVVNGNTSSNLTKKSPTGSRTQTPVTTPTSGGRNPAELLMSHGFGSSSSRLYGGIGWKEKFEDSEKKRNHLVNLAQKATRDYEELRRRYHDLYSDNEKLNRKVDSATNQLDSLRKASEKVYDDYYKLKKRYESENREKSDALTRVDQYNKENRRLKRQSAALMMQINDPTSLASAFDAVCETDSAENDKEILYLRGRVHELETKVVDLDSELEKIKLTEFESQELAMLMNDSVNAENHKLKEQLTQLDVESRKTLSSLEDVTFEYENLKAKFIVNEEKLAAAEMELKKIMNEKNILQRQSLVFMNDAMDNRLMDALNQIGDLQTAMEDQKQKFEAQLEEIQNQLTEKESESDSHEIGTAAKIKSLEEQVESLRKRAEVAEQKLEDMPQLSDVAPPPPPPPPPMSGLGPPPPPPPPMMMPNIMTMGAGNGNTLNNSLQSAMGTLRRTSPNLDRSNGSDRENGTPPNGLTSSPQIDDVISQIKKGIKLKPMDRSLSRKPTELPKEPQEDSAVEEMRSILNNLRRRREIQ